MTDAKYRLLAHITMSIVSDEGSRGRVIPLHRADRVGRRCGNGCPANRKERMILVMLVDTVLDAVGTHIVIHAVKALMPNSIDSLFANITSSGMSDKRRARWNISVCSRLERVVVRTKIVLAIMKVAETPEAVVALLANISKVSPFDLLVD
jgi:hypothetical protein